MIPKLPRVTIMLAVAALTLAVVASAQSKDPFVGSWRLNVAKSKYTGPAPKSITSTYEAAGQGYKVSVRNEPAAGAVQQVLLHHEPRWQGLADNRQQSERRHGCGQTNRRQHARARQQEGRQGHDDAAKCRLS